MVLVPVPNYFAKYEKRCEQQKANTCPEKNGSIIRLLKNSEARRRERAKREKMGSVAEMK